MVVVTHSPPPLDTRTVSTFFAKDPLLGNLPVVIFHGPSTTTNTTLNSSRIQAHIFSIAGFQSFPRLTIAPNSPLYAAVHHLTPEKQADEVCRGLAVSLLKYYTELPKQVKRCLQELVALGRREEKARMLFDEFHAAELASRMAQVENASEIAAHITTALAEKLVSWIDVDIELSRGSVQVVGSSGLVDGLETLACDPEGQVPVRYGGFSQLIELFGTPTFLPTSKLRRAPSKPTNVGKSRTLAKEQVEALRRDMKEFLETERSYVRRLYDLATSPAVAFYRADQSSTDVTFFLQQLFPASLTEILDLNNDFLNRMEELMEEDDESLGVPPRISSLGKNVNRDHSGSSSFAELLLEFCPQFKLPYQDYLRASAQFPRILNDLLRDRTSGIARAVQETGEQQLRSWLIEPVQRLPRYSLLIDNMANRLPVSHVAVNKLLKSKDMITDICALDNEEGTSSSQTIERLRELVSRWPELLTPEGRLITIADAAELTAPYNVTPLAKEGAPSLLLLFADYVIVLRKLPGNTLSARGLQAELDHPIRATSVVAAAPGQGQGQGQNQSLSLAYFFRLTETRFMESNNGRLISLSCFRKALRDNTKCNPEKSTDCSVSTKTFCLLGSYEGKASRWHEEVARARIEQRFPEKLRESRKWSLRTLGPSEDNVGIVSAIFEDDSGPDVGLQRNEHGRIRIMLQEADNQVQLWDSSSYGEEILARISVMKGDQYLLEFRGYNDFNSTDLVSGDDFVETFLKRLNNLQRLHHQPVSTEMAQMHISFNQKVLETIRPRLLVENQSRSRFRPVSPVKALSNLLGSSSKEQFTPLKQPDFNMSDRTNYDPTNAFSSQDLGASSSSQPQPLCDLRKTKVTIVSSSENPAQGSLSQLETILATYLVALHSRCGNIVGKALRNRASADELRVNELYNTLIEDPGQHQAAAEVPVDVLFSAFEKFLNREWKDRIGAILSTSFLKQMHTLFDSPTTAHFKDRFKALLTEMTPQNRRAFAAIIRLLSELLDGAGNDGDRGALTAAFAEALVVEDNPQIYISILDRLVEDVDVLVDDPSQLEVAPNAITPGSLQHTRSGNNGSWSSNGSSLRKRFGFGTLSRENSKSESESKVGQIWRSLSKKASGEDSQSSSLSKAFVSRSKSTDTDVRKPLPSRPISRDRPGSASTPEDEQRSRPGSAHNTLSNLITIGENSTEAFKPLAKKKRRSSLSDLQTLQTSRIGTFASPTPPRRTAATKDAITPLHTAQNKLRTPSPIKPQRLASPQSPSKLPSPTFRKENIPPAGYASPPGGVANRRPNDGGSIKGPNPAKLELRHSRIPSFKQGLQERQSPSMNPSSPRKPSVPPGRLRIQSPQKLRERLDKEQKAIREAGPGLQAELDKIGAELGSLKLAQQDPNPIHTQLASRVSSMEKRMSTLLGELSIRTASIRSDLESTLASSEKKVKNLDDLRREANAENELLYERFNGELGKVLRSVKGGEGVEEMKSRMKEAQDEATKLRKENQKLRRENVGLKSQLSGT